MTYQKNFIKAIKLYMAEKDFDSLKEVADTLEIKPLTLYKIMDGTNNPTVEHIAIICNQCGFNANWVITGKGEKYIKKELQNFNILKELEAFNSALLKEINQTNIINNSKLK